MGGERLGKKFSYYACRAARAVLNIFSQALRQWPYQAVHLLDKPTLRAYQKGVTKKGGGTTPRGIYSLLQRYSRGKAWDGRLRGAGNLERASVHQKVEASPGAPGNLKRKGRDLQTFFEYDTKKI